MSSSHPDFAAVALLLSEPARAAMLEALMGGQALPAGELARRARVTPQTASEHLSKLTAGGLIRMEKYGRHRYYSLAHADVARALEGLASIAPRAAVRGLTDSLIKRDLSAARTCYDHLAGRLGVALTQALIERTILEDQEYQYAVTTNGRNWLFDFGVPLHDGEQSHRKFAPKCLDWTERRPHLGGWLGLAIAERMFGLRWLRRTANSRAIQVTDEGKRALEADLGVLA